MIVLVYLIVLLRKLLLSTIFCMVHPYIAILHTHNNMALRSYAHAHVNATPRVI